MNKDLKWIKENDLHLKREVECNILRTNLRLNFESFERVISLFSNCELCEYTLVTVSEFCFKMLLRIPFTEKVRFTFKKKELHLNRKG